MKRIFILLFILGIGNPLDQQTSASPPAPLSIGVHFGFFYSSLRPHGEWIEVEPDFYVWRPFHIDHQWRPYLMGRWAWTDYGWYWLSDEPFGWITYHYGRWYFDDYYGWIWVPDDVWGPAWVEWRYDNDYIGWAPLPPYATFRISIGIYFTTHWVAPVHYWNFVRYRHFGSVIHYRDTAPVEHTRRLIRTTRSGPAYQVSRDRVINRGVDRSTIERRGRVQISKVEVQEARKQSGERLIKSGSNQRIERIEVYRPSRDQMQRSTERIEARRADRALSIDMNKIERGRADSRPTSEERTPRIQERTEQRQPDRTVQRETRQQEQRKRELQNERQKREYKPRIRQEKSQQERKEMRRELIQRYEQKQQSSPPVNREPKRQQVERSREKTQNAQPNRPRQESRSGDSEEKRRR